MSKKTDDFITGLQIVGGVILAGTAVRHASNLIDGRLEEARYNYGNYPGPPHDRERIGDYLLSLQKQAQKDFDACAALLDARGSLPASVFEPAPAVDFTDWMVSAWENKTDFFISVFGFYDEGGQFCAAFYLRDLAGRWQLLTGVLESGWGEILLTHLVKGRPLAQIAHCLWVLAAIFGEPRYMVLARNGSLFYSKYRIAYMAAAPDRLLLEPVDLDEIFWRCLRCYGILESTAASDEKKRPFAPKNLAEPRDWQQFLTTETLTDGAVWVDFRVVGDTATAAFYARDGARHWHRVTGVAAQNWAEVLLDAAFYDLPTDIFTVWAQALTADHGTPALVTAWVMGRLMTLVTPYVVPKRLVEASEREAGEMLGLSGDALAAFENAKAKPATEIPSAAPRFASRTEQVKAGAPVWSEVLLWAAHEGQAGRDVVSWAMTYRAAREEYGKAPLTPYRAGDAGIITEKDRQALEAVPPPVKATFDDDFDEDDDEPPVISRWELEDIANAVKPLAEKLTLAAPFAEQYENSWLDSVTLSDACRTLPKTGQVLWVTGRKKRTRLYACRFWARNRRGQWAEVIDVADNGWSEIFIGAAYGVVKLSDLVRWVKKGGDETPDLRSDERRGTLRTVFAQGTDDPEVLETLPRTSLRAAYQAWEKLKDKVPRPGRRTVRPTEDFYDFIRRTTGKMRVTFGAEKTGDGGPSGITFWGCREGEVLVELLKVEAYGWAPVLLWVILKEKPDDVAAWVRSFLRFNPQETKPVLAAPVVRKKRTAKMKENV